MFPINISISVNFMLRPVESGLDRFICRAESQSLHATVYIVQSVLRTVKSVSQ